MCAVGPLKAIHQRTVHAWLALLEAPVLLEPVRPAGHALCILSVAEATFLQGLVGKRQLFILCRLEKEKAARDREDPTRPAFPGTKAALSASSNVSSLAGNLSCGLPKCP